MIKKYHNPSHDFYTIFVAKLRLQLVSVMKDKCSEDGEANERGRKAKNNVKKKKKM